MRRLKESHHKDIELHASEELEYPGKVLFGKE